MIALADPGSATFAGEFLIMAGVYSQGWGYAAIVALGIVLAAMYVLRLVSAVLHVRPGPAVREEALDLRPGELALVLPMVACLLVLSAWPALISQSSFPDDAPAQALTEVLG
jgi:NADH-quinone oxidoreductase subunit M